MGEIWNIKKQEKKKLPPLIQKPKKELLNSYCVLPGNNSRLIIDPQGYIKNGCPKQNKKENIFQYHYSPKEDIICNSNKLCTLYSINEVYL